MNFAVNFDRAPLLVIWEVTRSCALACRHCRAEAIMGRHPMELDLDEGKRLLDQIKEMGTPIIVFTGGDPLQRDDLEDLIRHAKSIGLRTGTIPATTPQMTLDRIISLREAGLDQMALSIDAARAEQHDNFRRVPGAFDKAMEGVKWAHEAGVPLQINTVLARWNAPYFTEIAEMVEELGAVFWEVFFLVPTGRGAVMDSCTAEQFETLFAELYELSKRVPYVIKVTEAPHYRAYVREREKAGNMGTEQKPIAGIGSIHHKAGGRMRESNKGINSGKGFCFVDHVGKVYPSGFLPLIAGDVREQSVIDIYRDSTIFRELRDVSLLKGGCRGCEFGDICGGSRARAYAMTDDYLAAEPFCVRAEARCGVEA